MLNNFVPYPRYERAVFIGDTATEYLAALKIYAYALVGGEVPSMELLHPQEKPLECVACAMHNKPQVLKSALTKIPADYVLLEDNHRAELNPASMKDSAVNPAARDARNLSFCGDGLSRTEPGRGTRIWLRQRDGL